MNAALIEAVEVSKVFRHAGGSRDRDVVAVDRVSFTMEKGQSLALCGESGSGKSTLARLVVGLTSPSSGTLMLDGIPADARAGRRGRRAQARRRQIVFQDPNSSLDRRQTAEDGLHEILSVHHAMSRPDRAARIATLRDQVGLSDRELTSLPAALSGGQRQRVAIMRALALEPELLVLDEAVSALDVCVQAQILNLLTQLRAELGLSYLFVSHDLAVVAQISEQILVLRRGRVVEFGLTSEVLDRPQHEYTRLLIDSIPGPGWQPSRRLGSLEPRLRLPHPRDDDRPSPRSGEGRGGPSPQGRTRGS